jgi:hypothetical protein
MGRVHRWERTFGDTGKKLCYAQVWLPGRLKPILNVRKGYETTAMREQDITKLIAAFEGRDSVGIEVVKDVADVIDAPTFDSAEVV